VQKLISKYVLAAHLALLAVAPLFLFPYCTSAQTAVVLLFLSLFAAFWIFLEPSRRNGEILHAARVRVFFATRSDPLFWIFCVLVAYATVRWLNGGVATVYYPAETLWRVRPPVVEGVPGSVDGEGFLPFAVVVSVLVIVMGCRHALGKAARLSFASCASVFAGSAGLAALWACRLGHGGALAATGVSWGDASFAGAAFGMHFIAGIAALCGMAECKWSKYLLLYSFGIGASGAAVVAFSPAIVAFAFLAAGAVVALASFVYVWMTQRPPDVLKCMAALILAIAMGSVIAVAAVPQSVLDERLNSLLGGFLPEGFSAFRARLSQIASAIWRDRVWFGAGLGSMPLEIKYCAVSADWAAWKGVAPKAVPNGWLQLLSERGVAGAIAVGAPLVAMTASAVVRLVKSWGRHAFLPLAFAGVAVVAVAVAETFLDSSAFRAESLMAAGAYLALAGSTFPVARKKSEDEN
jgi:hypothetical protein